MLVNNNKQHFFQQKTSLIVSLQRCSVNNVSAFFWLGILMGRERMEERKLGKKFKEGRENLKRIKFIGKDKREGMANKRGNGKRRAF